MGRINNKKMKLDFFLFLSTEAYKCTYRYCSKCNIVENSPHFNSLRRGCDIVMRCCQRKYACHGGRVCGYFRNEHPEISFQDDAEEVGFLHGLKNSILNSVDQIQDFDTETALLNSMNKMFRSATPDMSEEHSSSSEKTNLIIKDLRKRN